MKLNQTDQMLRSTVGLLAALAMAIATTASAQSLDDLFSQPGDQRFDSLPAAAVAAEQNEAGAARSPRAEMTPPRSPSDIKLKKTPGSSAQPAPSTAMQIRQQRALMQSRARIARLEAARWAGNPALRPSWNPDPYSSLRYANRNVISVPVFYRAR